MCDYPTLYKEKIRIARKQHKCCECRLMIEPAKPYQHIVGVWDGNFSDYKTCAYCAAARDDYASWLGDSVYYDCDSQPMLTELWVHMIDNDFVTPLFYKSYVEELKNNYLMESE